MLLRKFEFTTSGVECDRCAVASTPEREMLLERGMFLCTVRCGAMLLRKFDFAT